jgi:hypothetical protein
LPVPHLGNETISGGLREGQRQSMDSTTRSRSMVTLIVVSPAAGLQ